MSRNDSVLKSEDKLMFKSMPAPTLEQIRHELTVTAMKASHMRIELQQAPGEAEHFLKMYKIFASSYLNDGAGRLYYYVECKKVVDRVR